MTAVVVEDSSRIFLCNTRNSDKTKARLTEVAAASKIQSTSSLVALSPTLTWIFNPPRFAFHVLINIRLNNPTKRWETRSSSSCFQQITLMVIRCYLYIVLLFYLSCKTRFVPSIRSVSTSPNFEGKFVFQQTTRK